MTMEEKNKKGLNIVIPTYIHRKIKAEAAKRGITITQLVLQSVMEHVSHDNS